MATVVWQIYTYIYLIYMYTHAVLMLVLVLRMSPVMGKSYLVPSRAWMETMAYGCSVLSGF